MGSTRECPECCEHAGSAHRRAKSPGTGGREVHAPHSENCGAAEIAELVETYRRDGIDVTCRLFRFGKHMIVALTGVRSALRFLSERLAYRKDGPT